MHGITTIGKLNREAAEAANILERHGHSDAAALTRQHGGIDAPERQPTEQVETMDRILANGGHPHPLHK